MILRTFLKRMDEGKSKLPARVLHWGNRIPMPLRNDLMEKLLNYALGQALAAGTFDFLSGHAVSVVVSDADVGITLTCRQRRLCVSPGLPADTEIAASALDLLRLIAAQIDADSLFFRQQLTIRGNVALGLEVKNALDGIDRMSLPGPVRHSLAAWVRWFAPEYPTVL
ncbi:Sterol-binding domain protein [mine drainage metagenome]|uniref:Sterol-binding domain protein n=1 Tax=mine drainage metagenome TaxID=410659 RepID=T0ZP36_9ZZZZ